MERGGKYRGHARSEAWCWCDRVSDDPHPAGDSFGTELAGLLSTAFPFRRHQWSHRQVWSVCVCGSQPGPRPSPSASAGRDTAHGAAHVAAALLLPMISEAVRFAFSRSLLGFLEFGPSGSPGPTQATRAGFHHPFPCAWGNSLLYVLHVPRLQSSTVTALSGSRAQQPLSDGAGRNRKQRGAGPVGHGSAIVLVS